jgi:hypothetical protein
MSGYEGRGTAGYRRRRRGRGLIVAVVVIIVLLVAADFAAKAVAENVLASKIEQEGLSTRPDVTIDGFPFLTQVARRDFTEVQINASNVREGPVTFTSIDAEATGIRLNSYAFNSGTIGQLHGTLLIDFSSLGNTLTTQVGPLGTLLHGAGLTLAAAGPSQVRASMNLIVETGSATWQISRVSGSDLNIRLVSSSGLPASLLSSIQDITLQIPRLPMGLTIDSVQVTPAGVVGTVSGQDVPFGT